MSLFFRFTIFIFLLTVTGLKSQPYTFLNYSLSEGLPQSQVLCAYTDTRAYLWLGTAGGGLCRYDGEHFTVFTLDDGLPSNYIRTIFQNKDYQLWIGTSRGLSRFDGHHFIIIKGIHSAVTTLSAFQDSLLLIGTNEGLFTLSERQDSIIRFSNDSIGNILSVYTDTSVSWIGTPAGLWKLESSSTHPIFIAKMLGQGIYSIAPSGNESLWLASWNVGIIQYNITSQKIDTVIRDQLLQLPQCIYDPGDGHLWVGTQNNGLILLDLKFHQLIQLAELEGLPHNNVKAITVDHNGQLWIATSGGGIAKCLKQNFRQYSRSEGLSSNRVYATYAARDGRVWLAVGNSGVQQIDSFGIHSYRLDSLIAGVKCKTITEDITGRIWIGTEGRGIVVIDEKKAILLNRHDGLQDDWIQKIASDKKGNIWVASFTNGLVSIQEDTSNNYIITPFPLPFQKLSSLFIDESDRVWVGSNDGRIVCIIDSKVAWESSKESNLPVSAIKSLANDIQGRLWIGTESKGVYYGYPNQENEAFQQLSGTYALHSQNIYLLRLDHDGQMWVGTETGVDKITFEPKGAIKAIIHYGKNEGFLGIETCHDAASIDDRGQIWFGTMNGLMRYTPGEDINHHVSPKIHFENVAIFYKPIQETSYALYASEQGGLLPGLILAYRDNHVSFDFRAVDLDYPAQIVYRWKLNGTDHDWSPPSKQPGVNYASLTPGNYTLLVQAATDDRVWSDPIEASFSIETPFWQKKSFWILTALGALAFILLLFYAWSKRLKKREYARRHQLELQNRLLQLEQKALQLQMNPHFIFNALTSIKSLVTKEELSLAQEEINAFAQLMRGVLNNSRKQSISLKEEVAVLDKYLHMEQFCHQDKFEYKIQWSEEIDPEEIEIPPMLLQPFVENAVVHGVAHLKHEGMIDIQFTSEGDLLICIVRDNGVGREKAARLREEKKPGHQSIALEVTKERLEALRNERTYVPLLIEDIVNDQNEIKGTQVTLRMPMKGNW